MNTALESLDYTTKITLQAVPKQWLPGILLFDPYLPQFPLIYIHFIYKDTRIYGFPISMSVDFKEEQLCDITFYFLSNIDLEKDEDLKERVLSELEERIGLADALDMETVSESCKENKVFEEFFSEIWCKYIMNAMGDRIPFGRLYEEVFSIIRFTAALASPSGRKSEMQMTYDFMSFYGKKIEIKKDWDYFEFYLMPCYSDLLEENLKLFPTFSLLLDTCKKFGDLFFQKKVAYQNIVIKTLDRSLPQSDEEFRRLTHNLLDGGKITVLDKKMLDFLVDAFNRFPLRAISFIGTIININKENDFHRWTKEQFVYYYTSKEMKGISMKVAGCFIQQGFGNRNVLPIDIWVEAFYQNVLGIESKEELFQKFENLGMLERLIWFIAQGRKVNSHQLYDAFWCIKFGTPKASEDGQFLRGPNPLSCFECYLRVKCPAYQEIAKKKVVCTSTINEVDKDIDFYIKVENNLPKKVYKWIKKELRMTDEFSGYILHNNRLKDQDLNKEMSVEEMIKKLGKFIFKDQ